MDCHKYSDHCGKNISDGLCKENSIQSQQSRKKQNHRDKTNSLSASAQKQTFFCFPHHQKEERINGIETKENERHSAAPQSNFSDFNHLHIIFCKGGNNAFKKKNCN